MCSLSLFHALSSILEGMEYLIVGVAGLCGGMARGFVGFIQHQFRFKDVPFKLYYFLGMISLSGCVGIVVALASAEVAKTFFNMTNVTFGLAIIVGYAGGDFIEILYKLLSKKIFVFPKKE